MTLTRFTYSLTGIMILFFMAACDMQQEVTVKLPPHEETYVVECFLEPGQEHQVLMTRSVDFFEGKWLEGVDGAEIIISSGEEERKLINLNKTDTLFYKVFNYYHPDKVVYEEGKEYQITIKYGDEVKASGKTRFLPKVEISDIYFRQNSDSLLATYVEIADNPDEDNYYRLILGGGVSKGGNNYGTNYDGVWDDSRAVNGKLTMNTAHILPPEARIAVKVYHIDKKYYEFLKSVQQAREANYNPFMQPASVKSTLNGALGAFSAISLTSDTVIVRDDTL